MLVGPRQSGKTTVLKRLEAELRDQTQKTLWLNLDFEDDYRHVSSQKALLQKIKLELGKSGGVVFIDEIQRQENAGLLFPEYRSTQFRIGGIRGHHGYPWDSGVRNLFCQ
jgi:predicted AAA+ superfamily ATPase